jgi:hypothetical protein
MIPIPPALMMELVNRSVRVLIRRRSRTRPKEAVPDEGGSGGGEDGVGGEVFMA